MGHYQGEHRRRTDQVTERGRHVHFGREIVRVTLFRDGIYYAKNAHPGAMAKLTVIIRTALRGALTLLLEHKGQFFMVDTNIPKGVPSVVRFHSAHTCGRLAVKHRLENL
jgi:hypothetical protein